MEKYPDNQLEVFGRTEFDNVNLLRLQDVIKKIESALEMSKQFFNRLKKTNRQII